MLHLVISCFLLLLVPGVGVGQNSPGPGIFALRAMLQDKDPEIRTKAAEGLGRVGGRESILILRQGLSDPSLEVRISVVEALGFSALRGFKRPQG